MYVNGESDKKTGAMAKSSINDLSRQQSVGQGITAENSDHLLRRLTNRHIQLIAIGGSIGTGLFVSIGNALNQSGPAGLLLAFILYCTMVGLVNNCMAEMITYFPVAGGFIRLAGHFVDEAFGFMAGWNFFLYQAFLIPFEISALAIVVKFWGDEVPIWSMCLMCIVLYAILNLLVVDAYGEAEFWLSGGKVVLVFSFFLFTFITMVGGNPKHDAYGFRYWKNPGAFAEYRSSGNLGRWEGFLAALWNVSFTVVGPEYISLIAAEAKHPRTYLKAAYKTIYFRFLLFFLGSALCVGIVLPHNDPTLVSIVRGGSSGAGTAAASPYVIAMSNLGVTIFPHVVNFLLVTSIFSAGNTYVYCASRSLYGLALEGRAPKFLTKCTRNGIPIYCFLIAICFAGLSFLQVKESTASFLNTLINLVTAGAFINYVVMSITYICFYRAMKFRGYDRKSLSYYAWFQPYCAWIGLAFFTCIVGTYGYATFNPWDIEGFFGCYTMAMLSIIFFVFWKVVKRTNFVDPHHVDLIWERPVVDAYENTATEAPSTFWREMRDSLRIQKYITRRNGEDMLRGS
ncbi:amino acid permease/ SLC12A domain-containing protein [Annulohypoxylon moriforme]|nr:amino acid permease/ SLC12A domain-containing protein [Annulohypoxylon moriforme]